MPPNFVLALTPQPRAASRAAVVAPNSVKAVRLPDNASIFTAEIHALDMALDIIRRTRSKVLCGFLGLFV